MVLTPRDTGVGTLFAAAFVVAARLTVEEVVGNSATCPVGGGCREVLSSPAAHLGPIPISALGCRPCPGSLP
ncbi:MAG: hypothetical protein ACK41F_10075 [Fimbriimonadaceae bacterium]